jgi:hypothetical protein
MARAPARSPRQVSRAGDAAAAAASSAASASTSASAVPALQTPSAPALPSPPPSRSQDHHHRRVETCLDELRNLERRARVTHDPKRRAQIQTDALAEAKERAQLLRVNAMKAGCVMFKFHYSSAKVEVRMFCLFVVFCFFVTCIYVCPDLSPAVTCAATVYQTGTRWWISDVGELSFEPAKENTFIGDTRRLLWLHVGAAAAALSRGYGRSPGVALLQLGPE